ncbi:hypothetical protein ATANTOWER_002927 [Ataeniobius toweri]|uniref:Uncharacterized protein n=1 Tax=Ataeniobius toweri TaxID=208326 RepID=A0ABU7AM59_9TELE|nr:hypothetical protein [Ataeniobius toweri]
MNFIIQSKEATKCCVHFSVLLSGNHLNSLGRLGKKKWGSQTEFCSYSCLPQLLKHGLKCAHHGWVGIALTELPPSLIWCFQVCAFTRAYTKAVITSQLITNIQPHTCGLKGIPNLPNVSPNIVDGEAKKA